MRLKTLYNLQVTERASNSLKTIGVDEIFILLFLEFSFWNVAGKYNVY